MELGSQPFPNEASVEHDSLALMGVLLQQGAMALFGRMHGGLALSTKQSPVALQEIYPDGDMHPQR